MTLGRFTKVRGQAVIMKLSLEVGIKDYMPYHYKKITQTNQCFLLMWLRLGSKVLTRSSTVWEGEREDISVATFLLKICFANKIIQLIFIALAPNAALTLACDKYFQNVDSLSRQKTL